MRNIRFDRRFVEGAFWIALAVVLTGSFATLGALGLAGLTRF
jgi:hypothetical protein